jgi:hypothetical protein
MAMVITCRSDDMGKIAENGVAGDTRHACRTCGGPLAPLKPGEPLPPGAVELADGAYRGVRGLYDESELWRALLVRYNAELLAAIRRCERLFELGQDAEAGLAAEDARAEAKTIIARAQTLLSQADLLASRGPSSLKSEEVFAIFWPGHDDPPKGGEKLWAAFSDEQEASTEVDVCDVKSARVSHCLLVELPR